jgi:hypothetical protein
MMFANFEDINDAIGNHMTKTVFIRRVKAGALMDRDGFGHLATKDKVSNHHVHASDVKDLLWPDWATHVVWYNR